MRKIENRDGQIKNLNLDIATLKTMLETYEKILPQVHEFITGAEKDLIRHNGV